MMAEEVQPPRHARTRPLWPRRALMLVTDRTVTPLTELPAAVDAAIRGGVNVVQLREKDLPAGELLQAARALRGVTAGRALLIVNDRVDVALLSGADGVHLGEEGLPVAAVRRFLPRSMVVGRSVHGVNAARQAEQDGADYLLLGTIFATPSKPGVTPGGVDLVRQVSQRVGLPVIAIGGVTDANAGEVVAAGAAGIAAISAFLRAPDPEAASRALAAYLEDGDATDG